MLTLNDDLSIYLTRGDAVSFSVSAYDGDGNKVPFTAGDIVRFKVTEKKNCSAVVLQKDFAVSEDAEAVNITLTSRETKLGDVISKPVDYWYEVESNPDTDPQTIIGYDDESGAKIFRIFPEGADMPPYEPDPEQMSAIDDALSLASDRPVQNKVIARAVVVLDERMSAAEKTVKDGLAGFRKEIDSNTGTAAVALAAHNENKDAHPGTFASKPVFFTVPSGTEWTADADKGGYTQTVALEGILETDVPDVDVFLGDDLDANELYKEAWACVDSVKTANGSIILRAPSTVPTSAFTIRLKVVR